MRWQSCQEYHKLQQYHNYNHSNWANLGTLRGKLSLIEAFSEVRACLSKETDTAADNSKLSKAADHLSKLPILLDVITYNTEFSTPADQLTDQLSNRVII